MRPGIRLTPEQTHALNAVADTLIPGGEGFPAPSAVDVLSFVRRYVAPQGQSPRWYPFLAEQHVTRWADTLGRAFVQAGSEARTAELRVHEREHPEVFSRVRDLVCQAYYSRPEVVRAIREQLTAGRDYRITPQPFGYDDSIADWDEQLLSGVRG